MKTDPLLYIKHLSLNNLIKDGIEQNIKNTQAIIIKKLMSSSLLSELQKYPKKKEAIKKRATDNDIPYWGMTIHSNDGYEWMACFRIQKGITFLLDLYTNVEHNTEHAK